MRYFISFLFLVIGFCAPAAADGEANRDISERIDSLYERVFADPSNVSLNLELVRTQLQINDLKGASGTLDRLLILSPDNRAAQLLMARVKIATRNLQEAKYLLQAVIDAPDSDPVTKNRAQEALRQVDEIADGFSWQASSDVTIGISQNPENKPNKDAYSLYLPTSPIAVSGASQEFRGASLSALFDKRFNTYDDRRIQARLGHQRRDYSTYDKSDYEVYSGSIAMITGDKMPVSRTISALRVRVRERDFMDQIGLELNRQIAGPFGISLSASGYLGRQIHRTHRNFTGNKEKTGMLGRASLSGTMMLGPRAVRSSLEFERKSAKIAKNAFYQTKLKFDTNIPVFGIDLLGQASFARKRFDAPDMVFSDRRRRDMVSNLSLELQVPVSHILPKNYHDMRVSLRGDIYRTFSNVDRFDSTKSELMMKVNYALGGR